MRSLSTSDGSNATAVTLETARGNISGYKIDADTAWNTQAVGIDGTVQSLNFQINEVDSVTSTGTVKLQFSVDGINFVDVTGKSYTIPTDLPQTLVYETKAQGYLRWNNDGSATGGTVAIIWEKR